jgi:threonine dehydrogenase-like Zn-dependent dehydrogenase
MRALVFHGPWEMTVEDRPEPEPGAGDALLEIIATGICGTDLHGYTGENGRRHPGQVMGHETVARILTDKTGTHAPGSIVTVNPVMGCGRCPACAAGAPQRCPKRRVIGVDREISSAFAERMVAPAHNLVPLAPGTPAELGSLIEPLAVGFHAAQRADVATDDTVLVVGGGPIGQAAALAARRIGSTTVVVAELEPMRRDLVARLGFVTVDPQTQSADEIVAMLGRQPTVVIDAVGTSQTLQRAFDVAALGARIALVGMGAPRVELSAYAISTQERTVVGSFGYDEAAFRETAEWVATHVAELEPLVDTRVDLAAAPEIFRALANHELAASKVLVFPAGPPARH